MNRSTTRWAYVRLCRLSGCEIEANLADAAAIYGILTGVGPPHGVKPVVTAAGVQFRVLGPLEIEAGGGVLELGGPRLRALLAYL
jgi:hypothetical protein